MTENPLSWNVAVIYSAFNPPVAATIIKIPLRPIPHEDKWIWRQERSGFFTVCSAYWLAQKLLLQAKVENWNHHELKNVWKQHLWKMKVPHKICIFAWGGCKDGLPCFYNLRKRQVEVDDSCLFWGNQEEDIAHALFYCPEISHLWQLFLPQVQQAPPRLDFLRLVEWFLDYGGSEVLPKLFTIAWSLWNRRNKRVFEETTVS